MYGADWAAAGYVAAHQAPGPIGHFFRGRVALVAEILAGHPGGALLDAGCGPGIMVRHLADRRPGEFAITGLDRSGAMIAEARRILGDAPGVELRVGRIEAMPSHDARYDAVVVMGVLEYVEVVAALREVARVTRPDGVVTVTMLNPWSPYRTWERAVYLPVRRMRSIAEKLLGVPPERRRGEWRNCVRLLGERDLTRLMRAVGLSPQRTVYFDMNLLVPPIDRMVPGLAVTLERLLAPLTRTRLRRLATSYAVVARRDGAPAGRG
ncbi:MAG: class I SAM-dependent methyltransferase [Actinomycetota bacterium]